MSTRAKEAIYGLLSFLDEALVPLWVSLGSVGSNDNGHNNGHNNRGEGPDVTQDLPPIAGEWMAQSTAEEVSWLEAWTGAETDRMPEFVEGV